MNPGNMNPGRTNPGRTKVFVCGGTGVVGRRAVRELVAAGHEVTAMARTDAKAELLGRLGAHPVEVDLFDATAVKEAVAGHDAVVNLATKIPPLSRAVRSTAWAENDRIRTSGSGHLVDAAIANGASRYVQESIAFLYGDHDHAWIDETEPPIDSPYTSGAMAAEANAARFTEAGGVGVVLRFGMFYAADSPHTVDLIRFARRGWYAVPGRTDRHQPMISADDAARAVVAALDAPAGVYNVVDDDPLTLTDAAAAVATALDRTKVRTAPRVLTWMAGKKAPNLVTSQRVSNRRFSSASGWAPRYPSLFDGFPVVLAELASRSS